MKKKERQYVDIGFDKDGYGVLVIVKNGMWYNYVPLKQRWKTSAGARRYAERHGYIVKC